MKKLCIIALMTLFGINLSAANFPCITAGTYDVGVADNPGGWKKISSYPLNGMYLYQAPSGHSFGHGSGQWTGIYTIYSESGIVFCTGKTMDITVVLDAGSFAAEEYVSATLYSISEDEYSEFYYGSDQSTEIILSSKDEYESSLVQVTGIGTFQQTFSDIPAGYYFVVCHTENLSNVIYFNQIIFADVESDNNSGNGGNNPQSTNRKIKVHTIGDSTMADYDENTTDKRGWGMYLGSFFDPDFVTVNNRAKSGADTRQFYTSSNLWASVKSQMAEGDYLLIQFAHNDEGTVTYGIDNLEYAAYCSANNLPAPTDARGTNPQTTYRDFLRTFIDEARALGVNPVLVGPICRKYFNGDTIRRNGQHDLGDNFSKIENGVLYTNQSVPATDHSMDYVYAMSVVAQEKNVPFINLTEATRDLYLQYGEQQCTQLLFCSGDNTHTATLGANLIARQAAQMLKDADVLTDYINIPTSITATPNAVTFGETYADVQRGSEVVLTGFGLEPAAGTVNITVSGDVLISTDNENFAASAQVSYAGSTLFLRIYLHASYGAAGEKNDSIVITSGATRIVVPVTASVISLDGGSAVSAYWAIDARPVPVPVVIGPISADMTLSYMIAADTKEEFTDGTASNIMMVRFHNSDANGTKTAWPANEIDENATRYIDFAVTAPAANEVRITGISMDITSHSTATMCCHINTGFGDNFLGVQTIYERKNFTNLQIEHLVLTPMLTIPAGDTLHVRILPWHENADVKSGKYICIKNVLIEGQAFDPSAMDGIENTTTEQNTKATKIMLNGEITIIKDGKMYNTLGIKL